VRVLYDDQDTHFPHLLKKDAIEGTHEEVGGIHLTLAGGDSECDEDYSCAERGGSAEAVRVSRTVEVFQ